MGQLLYAVTNGVGSCYFSHASFRILMPSESKTSIERSSRVKKVDVECKIDGLELLRNLYVQAIR
jgi:hypothetical protein